MPLLLSNLNSYSKLYLYNEVNTDPKPPKRKLKSVLKIRCFHFMSRSE